MSAPAPFKALLGARCVDDATRLKTYEIPERGAPGQASCVLLPESEEEVGAILRVADAQQLKLVISAGRTGLVEAQRPQGEAVLSLERLKRIKALDAELGLVEAEAGLAVDALNETLAPQGWVLPMEMGSSSAATVGACVANASAGANAVCYGTAAQMCEQAWGYWGSGQPAGPHSAPAWSVPAQEELAINSARIRPEWGLIGSQGVLGIITRVQLRLTRLPAQREAALIPVPDMQAAMRIFSAARDAFDGDVEEFEFISRAALRLVREARGSALRLPFAGEVDAPFYLLLQIKSVLPAAQDDLTARLYDFLSHRLTLPDEHIGYAPLKTLKEIRHSITESSNLRAKKLGGGRLSFDTATPVAEFGPYLAELQRRIATQYPHIEFVAFGHAGVGGAHLHLLGTAEYPVQPLAEKLVELVFDITQQHGGTFSAEHGVGPKWGEEFIQRTPRAGLEALVALKRERDPHNVLNPRSFGLDRLLAAQA